MIKTVWNPGLSGTGIFSPTPAVKRLKGANLPTALFHDLDLPGN